MEDKRTRLPAASREALNALAAMHSLLCANEDQFIGLFGRANDEAGYWKIRCRLKKDLDAINGGFEMSEWISVQEQLPEEGIIVNTKIDDENGVRNIKKLTRKGNLWLLPDLSVYVYYTPTHWKIV